MSAYKIEITIIAEEEYSSASHYYEEQQSGLGDKFEKETDYLIDKLKENPYLFERKYKHYREAIFKRFPYFICLRNHGQFYSDSFLLSCKT